MTDWLGLAGKRVLVTGLSNKRSVAAHIGRQLREAGALPVWMVRTEERREEVAARGAQALGCVRGDAGPAGGAGRRDDQVDQRA